VAYIDTEGGFRCAASCCAVQHLLLCIVLGAAQLQSLSWVLAEGPASQLLGPNLPLTCPSSAPTCRPERIRPIAERYGLDADAVLDNVVFARAHTYEQQFGGCCLPALLQLGVGC
jgi:hypothetical protein